METVIPSKLAAENRPKKTPVVVEVIKVSGGEVNNQTV